MTRLTASDLGSMQRDQYHHDLRNHFDIISLHKADRLKHYGLHYCKYAGRIARGVDEAKPYHRTLVDAFLVMLSASNTLHQDLYKIDIPLDKQRNQIDSLRIFIDAAGRFADACEKVDHLEDFVSIAKRANTDISLWLVSEFHEHGIDAHGSVHERRTELAKRQFFIEK